MNGQGKVRMTKDGDQAKTIIYAQKAHLFEDPKTGVPNPAKEPVIVEVATEAQMAAEIRFPLFKADVDPDYKFFGFDLTIDEARGADHPQAEADDWGYYFVIQQIPGEPRFGMDIAFLVLLSAAAGTGFAVLWLRDTWAMGILLAIHLGGHLP